MAGNGNLARLYLKLFNTSGGITLPYVPEESLGAKLIEYWDAIDEGTARVTNNAGKIEAWAGRKTGLTLVAAAGARPDFSESNYCGGRKSFAFDGIAHFLRVDSVAGLPSGETAGRIWVLYEAIGAAAATTQIIAMGGTAGATRRLISRASSERLQISDGATALTGTGTPASTLGKQVAMGRWSGTEEGGRIRGEHLSPLTATIATLNTTATRITFGASNGNTPVNFSNVAITAILITSDDLTLDESQRLESWGYREMDNLADLPADHPYKEGPDETILFTTAPTAVRYSSRPSLLPVTLDFRERMFNQITTECATGGYVYNSSGVLVPVALNTAHWLDHDPVTNEPLGLKCFSSVAQIGVNRSTPATQDVTLVGPDILSEFTEFRYYFYSFGTGSMRVQTTAPVNVLNADGSDSGVDDDDITYPSVDETADGWYAGYHGLSVNAGESVTATLTFTGSVDYFQITRGVPMPPHLEGAISRVPLMTSPLQSFGLPSDVTDLTIALLFKTSHMINGGQWLQFDDDIPGATSPTGVVANCPVRLNWNYLGNPNPSNPPKAGQMGLTIVNNTDSGGVDPEDVLVEALKWRCFITSIQPSTGLIRVCCNGGTVREETFDVGRFPTYMKRIRWMQQLGGGQTPDGWLGGAYGDPQFLSAGDMQTASDPATSVFGVFDDS